MRTKPTIPFCAFCGAVLPPASATGRPRKYCDNKGACKTAAHRNRHLPKTVAPDIDTSELELPPQADTDEQAAQTLLEAETVMLELLSLGDRARPAFAWRCALVGEAMRDALDKVMPGRDHHG